MEHIDVVIQRINSLNRDIKKYEKTNTFDKKIDINRSNWLKILTKQSVEVTSKFEVEIKNLIDELISGWRQYSELDILKLSDVLRKSNEVTYYMGIELRKTNEYSLTDVFFLFLLRSKHDGYRYSTIGLSSLIKHLIENKIDYEIPFKYALKKTHILFKDDDNFRAFWKMFFPVKRAKEISANEAQDILNNALAGAFLQGFHYYRTAWTIRFSLEPDTVYQGGLPWDMYLSIEGQWHIGTIQDWTKAVSQLYRTDLLEPVEPIRAYELTALMWSKNSGLIERVLCSDDSIKLILEGNREIVILNQMEENVDIVWGFADRESLWSSEWSLVWGGGYFYND